MSTDNRAAEISLLQVSDSLFPTGLYAASSGLETAYAQDREMGHEKVAQMILAQIEQQIGPCDCTAAACAYDLSQQGNMDALIELDETVFALKGVKESREASARSGAQTLKAACFMLNDSALGAYLKRVQSGAAAGTYPVAFGMVSASLRIGKRQSAQSLLYGFAASVVGAALRLGIMQHLDGQKTLHDLGPAIADAAAKGAAAQASDMWQFAPQMDIIQMAHERADSRMFVT